MTTATRVYRSILRSRLRQRRSSPNFVRTGPPVREDNAERRALVARMQAAAKTRRPS